MEVFLNKLELFCKIVRFIWKEDDSWWNLIGINLLNSWWVPTKVREDKDKCEFRSRLRSSSARLV